MFRVFKLVVRLELIAFLTVYALQGFPSCSEEHTRGASYVERVPGPAGGLDAHPHPALAGSVEPARLDLAFIAAPVLEPPELAAASAAGAPAIPLDGPGPLPEGPGGAGSPPRDEPPPAAAARLGRDEVRAAAARAGWPDALLDDVVVVACGRSDGSTSGESGCRPDAWNPDGPFAGLLQVWWPFWWTENNAECRGDPVAWADPVENLRIAWCVYQYYGGWAGGWPHTQP